MKYAVVLTNGNLGYVANGEPKGLPDKYAGAIPLAEESDPEPKFLSRSVACSKCGESAEDKNGKIGTVKQICHEEGCSYGPASHAHTIMTLCVSCGNAWKSATFAAVSVAMETF